MAAVVEHQRRLSAVLGREVVTTAPPGVLFRKARVGDLDDIETMSKGLHGNRDFLIANYLHYLDDPNRYLHVAVTEGHVVCRTIGLINTRPQRIRCCS